jgi:hypothetical protein
MKKYLFLLIVVTLTACASSRGFDRSNLRSQMTDQKVVTEEDIKKALELKPQLPIPFKLAIYFAPPKSGSPHGTAWKWVSEDKDKLLEIATELKNKKVVSDIFVIGDSIVEGRDNKAIRLGAARAGADAVLIINGISDVDRYNNILGPLYILLLTGFFIPGTEADALVMIDAAMWDVRNQYLYLSVEAEATAKETRPAFFVKESRIIKTAKTEALAALKKELEARLSSFSSK